MAEVSGVILLPSSQGCMICGEQHDTKRFMLNGRPGPVFCREHGIEFGKLIQQAFASEDE